ncbi:MAG TPA: ABC-type transport auxiliary lipoprotein family protein [Candidatus Acidoferrales bacterium]|nr:ABC-type transport auxiliary lipoprotein family protein [Candidatus Acidoferrales bacterium]
MRLRFRVIAPMAAACAVLLAGCGAARPIKYYSLDPPAVTPAAQRLDVSLLIGRIGAPLVYRDTRIVYRTGANELGLYDEHRWAEAPALMVEEMLLQSLRKSGRYRSVQLIASNAQGDYIVRGRVERFEEVEGKPMTARVWLHLSLYDPKTGHTVWTQNYEQDQDVAGSDVASVAAAMSQNLQHGIQELAAGIDQYLTAHPRAASPTN